MKKVFLYLYPIQEYITEYLLPEDYLYDLWKIERPLPILKDCIQERYRNRGYEVIFVLYSDKEIYGIPFCIGDKIIRVEETFGEMNSQDENGLDKENFIPRYPNEGELIKKLGNVDYLVVSGFHAQDCVKRYAIKAYEMGISTLVDLDLTDFFFYLYKRKEYFCIRRYNPYFYKEYAYNLSMKLNDGILFERFKIEYSSPVYGFYDEEDIKIK